MKLRELVRYAKRHTFKSTQDFFREVESAETVILSYETWDRLLDDSHFLEMFKQTMDKKRIQKEIIPEVWGSLETSGRQLCSWTTNAWTFAPRKVIASTWCVRPLTKR
jgi:hypothetical protein